MLSRPRDEINTKAYNDNSAPSCKIHIFIKEQVAGKCSDNISDTQKRIGKCYFHSGKNHQPHNDT